MVTTLDVLAKRSGLTIRRGKSDPRKVWLIFRGELITPSKGISTKEALNFLEQRTEQASEELLPIQ